MSAAEGIVDSSQCDNCTAGYYCPSSGLVEATASCLPGFYCPAGTDVPSLVCTVGHYCDGGEIVPNPCAAGSYQNATSQASCRTCPAGPLPAPFFREYTRFESKPDDLDSLLDEKSDFHWICSITDLLSSPEPRASTIRGQASCSKTATNVMSDVMISQAIIARKRKSHRWTVPSGRTARWRRGSRRSFCVRMEPTTTTP